MTLVDWKTNPQLTKDWWFDEGVLGYILKKIYKPAMERQIQMGQFLFDEVKNWKGK